MSKSVLLPTVKTCSICHGAGKVSGVFHRLDCVNCNALGFVDEQTGHIVEPDDAIQVLQQMRRASLDEIDRLNKRLTRLEKYERQAIRDEQIERIYPSADVTARRRTRSTGHGD